MQSKAIVTLKASNYLHFLIKNMTLSKRLDDLIKKLNLTQVQIAEIGNVT